MIRLPNLNATYADKCDPLDPFFRLRAPVRSGVVYDLPNGTPSARSVECKHCGGAYDFGKLGQCPGCGSRMFKERTIE